MVNSTELNGENSMLTTNPLIMINDHGNDGNHKNGIRDLTDKGIVVSQLFL